MRVLTAINFGEAGVGSLQNTGTYSGMNGTWHLCRWVGLVKSIGEVEKFDGSLGTILRRKLVLDSTAVWPGGEVLKNTPEFVFYREKGCEQLDNLEVGQFVSVAFWPVGRIYTTADGREAIRCYNRGVRVNVLGGKRNKAKLETFLSSRSENLSSIGDSEDLGDFGVPF